MSRAVILATVINSFYCHSGLGYGQSSEFRIRNLVVVSICAFVQLICELVVAAAYIGLSSGNVVCSAFICCKAVAAYCYFIVCEGCAVVWLGVCCRGQRYGSLRDRKCAVGYR